MDISSYISEIKQYTDLNSLNAEDLIKELIDSVHRLKLEQDSWSPEKMERIKKASETFQCPKSHDKDIEEFQKELAKTIWNLIMLSERHRADFTDVLWEDIYRRRVENTPKEKEDFKNIVLKKMTDKLVYQARWNSKEFDYAYTLEYEFKFLGTLDPKAAADYLLYIRDNAVAEEPLQKFHIEKLLIEFAYYSKYDIGDSWASSLFEYLGINSDAHKDDNE
jgi:hypothetical protein